MPLNPAILAWLGLAAAPVIIHLLNRRRYRVLQWGAMQFLDESVAKSSKRLRIEQLLIMLIRMLIIALVVYAMGRPYLPGAVPGLPAARPKRNAVVVLDRSMSMRYDEPRISNFAQAKEAVARVIGVMEDGDSLNVVLAGGKPQTLTPEPIVELGRLTEMLKDVEPVGTEANFAQAFEEALSQLEKSHNPLREVYVITDRSAFGWHAESESHWYAALARLQNAPTKPTVHVLPVGVQQRENAAVVGLTPATGSIGIYQPTRFDVRITNFGEEKRTKMNVIFSVEDDANQQIARVDVPPGESVTTSFHHRFTAPGSKLVKASITPDALPFDDEMQTSVDVYDAIPVLLVDGTPGRTSPSPNLERGQGVRTLPGPLELALRPRDKDNPDFKSLLAVQVCSPAEIPSLSSTKFHLVVLHDVPVLTHRQVSDLERYVDSGGGLLIFPGGHVSPDAYNVLLYRDGDGLLPSRIEQGPAVKNPIRVMAQAFTHPALAAFRDPKNGDFTRIEVYRYFRYAPDPRNENVRVLARLENGSPFIVERTFGQGKVFVCATPVDEDWTNLQKRSFFVPLVHYAAYYLAGSVQPPRNVLIGSALSSFIPLESKDAFLKVIDPIGKEQTIKSVQKGDRFVATFTGTERPGAYRMIGETSGNATSFVVRPPTQESNLTPLNPRERLWIEENVQASFAKDWDDLRSRVFVRAGQLREFWQLLIICALGLVLAETLLTGVFAKRSQAAP